MLLRTTITAIVVFMVSIVAMLLYQTITSGSHATGMAYVRALYSSIFIELAVLYFAGAVALMFVR